MTDPKRRHKGLEAGERLRRLGCLAAVLVGAVTLLVALLLRVFAPQQRGRPEGQREPGLPGAGGEHLEARYELEDVQPRGLLLALAAILGMVVLFFVVITVYLSIVTGRMGNFRPPVMGLAGFPQSALPRNLAWRRATPRSWTSFGPGRGNCWRRTAGSTGPGAWSASRSSEPCS